MSKTADRVPLAPGAGIALTLRNLEIFNSNRFRWKDTTSLKLIRAKPAPALAWLGLEMSLNKTQFRHEFF